MSYTIKILVGIGIVYRRCHDGIRQHCRPGPCHAAQSVPADGESDRRSHNRCVQGKGFQHRCCSSGPRRSGDGDDARRAGHVANVGNGSTQGVHSTNVPGPDQRVSKAHKGESTSAAQRDLVDILALGGGMPIQIGDETIGGVGSAGSSQQGDEDCAKAGIAKVADLLK